MLSALFAGSQYPTYLVFVAVFVAGLLTAVLMPAFIRVMRKDGIGQQVRADGPQTHLVKQGTPTMGGFCSPPSCSPAGRPTSSCASAPRWAPACSAFSTTSSP